MRNLLAVIGIVLAAVAVAVALSSSPTRSASSPSSAPADEYFGKMKLSYLGINNSLKDATIMAGDHTDFPAVIQKIAFAENAFLDWQAKYPSDPQLPRSMFLMARAYVKVWTADGQEKAAYYYWTLRDKYATTYFGKQAKADTNKGMTMHVYAAEQPCYPLAGQSTPAPLPAPTADPQRNISVQIEPYPSCTTPAPTPPALVPTIAPLSTSAPQKGVAAPATPITPPHPTPAPTPPAVPTVAPIPAPTTTGTPAAGPSATPTHT